MKVGDIVKFQSDIQGMDGLQCGIIIGENGAYKRGWVEVLYLDGQSYDDSDPEWEDFFEVLNESG